jgi:hypothetical protein
MTNRRDRSQTMMNQSPALVILHQATGPVPLPSLRCWVHIPRQLPVSDGQTECMNMWVEQYLCHWTTGSQRNWVPLLPIAEFAHNSWKHEAMQHSPHKLLLGYNPQVHVKFLEDSMPAAQECLEQVQKAREHAKECLMALQKHKDARRLREHDIGDQFWLEGTNLSVKGTQKLLPKWYGPFKIMERIGPVAYRLDLPNHMKIHDVFHIDLLMPHKETEEYGRPYMRPLPVLETGEQEYKIEAIRDM